MPGHRRARSAFAGALAGGLAGGAPIVAHGAAGPRLDMQQHCSRAKQIDARHRRLLARCVCRSNSRWGRRDDARRASPQAPGASRHNPGARRRHQAAFGPTRIPSPSHRRGTDSRVPPLHIPLAILAVELRESAETKQKQKTKMQVVNADNVITYGESFDL